MSQNLMKWNCSVALVGLCTCSQPRHILDYDCISYRAFSKTSGMNNVPYFSHACFPVYGLLVHCSVLFWEHRTTLPSLAHAPASLSVPLLSLEASFLKLEPHHPALVSTGGFPLAGATVVVLGRPFATLLYCVFPGLSPFLSFWQDTSSRCFLRKYEWDINFSSPSSRNMFILPTYLIDILAR